MASMSETSKQILARRKQELREKRRQTEPLATDYSEADWAIVWDRDFADSGDFNREEDEMVLQGRLVCTGSDKSRELLAYLRYIPEAISQRLALVLPHRELLLRSPNPRAKPRTVIVFRRATLLKILALLKLDQVETISRRTGEGRPRYYTTLTWEQYYKQAEANTPTTPTGVS